MARVRRESLFYRWISVAELIVPHSSLDSSVDIPFSEGPVNLNWQAIMKTVNDDPYEFFNEGGWGFLSTNDDVSRRSKFRSQFPTRAAVVPTTES